MGEISPRGWLLALPACPLGLERGGSRNRGGGGDSGGGGVLRGGKKKKKQERGEGLWEKEAPCASPPRDPLHLASKAATGELERGDRRAETIASVKKVRKTRGQHIRELTQVKTCASSTVQALRR